MEVLRRLADPSGGSLIHGDVYPVLIPTVVAVAAANYIFPERADLAFYETAAQVIPVLLILLAVEARMFVVELRMRKRSDPQPVVRSVDEFVASAAASLRFVYSLGLLFFMGLGELIALHGTTRGARAASGRASLVAFAIGGGVAGALIAAMRGTRRTSGLVAQ